MKKNQSQTRATARTAREKPSIRSEPLMGSARDAPDPRSSTRDSARRLRVPLQQRVEVVDRQALRPLEGFGLGAVGLAHEVERVTLRLEAAPDVAGAAAGAPQVEARIGRRRRLVGSTLPGAVQRCPPR